MPSRRPSSGYDRSIRLIASASRTTDWEWAGTGEPIQDLARCEWIVRMYHREHSGALEEFFAGYGHRPTWTPRHEATLTRCRSLLEMCLPWTAEAAGLWRHRLEVTATWTEFD